jgi:nucleoside-diphosphate-sugar epimerase
VSPLPSASLSHSIAPSLEQVTVLHLAALLSGYAEENFDLGMKVNLFGTINVIECVRSLTEELGGPQIYLYVFGTWCFDSRHTRHTLRESQNGMAHCTNAVSLRSSEALV